MNRYLYCNNNPFYYIDLDGNISISDIDEIQRRMYYLRQKMTECTVRYIAAKAISIINQLAITPINRFFQRIQIQKEIRANQKELDMLQNKRDYLAALVPQLDKWESSAEIQRGIYELVADVSASIPPKDGGLIDIGTAASAEYFSQWRDYMDKAGVNMAKAKEIAKAKIAELDSKIKRQKEVIVSLENQLNALK